MAKKRTFDAILLEYKDKYDVENIVNPNDLANLESMIRNQLIVDKLQARLETIAESDTIDASEIRKILESVVSLSDTNMKLERTLGIDRKTRKIDQVESFPDYLDKLKKQAREFILERLIRVICKKCNIMIGRVSPVYDTTEFNAEFQCPQCKKRTIVKRKERDIFFDIRDADWRKKYTMEVIQPKYAKGAPQLDITDDVVLDLDDGLIFED